MRAVFDTNVVISALIFGRHLAWLRNAWARGALIPVVCRETTDELLRVLGYPKFRLDPADRMALLEDYLPYADVVPLPDPSPNVPIVSRAPDDTIFVRLAAAAGVPLITGDGDLEKMRRAGPVRVLTAAEFRQLVVSDDL